MLEQMLNIYFSLTISHIEYMSEYLRVIGHLRYVASRHYLPNISQQYALFKYLTVTMLGQVNARWLLTCFGEKMYHLGCLKYATVFAQKTTAA